MVKFMELLKKLLLLKIEKPQKSILCQNIPDFTKEAEKFETGKCKVLTMRKYY